jgi:UMF1 family MFS transporter
MFGLFALSGRVTAFAGPAVLGWVTLWAESQRAGLATVLVFLLVGMVLLWTMVQEPARGQSDA